MADQHEQLTDPTVQLLHSAILQTGADVRAVGAKMDTFIATQSAVNISQAGEIARLKGVDETQQKDIDALKEAPTQHRSHRVAVLGVVMGALGFLGCVLQAVAAWFHK